MVQHYVSGIHCLTLVQSLSKTTAVHIQHTDCLCSPSGQPGIPNLSSFEHVWDQLRHQLRLGANLQALEGQVQHCTNCNYCLIKKKSQQTDITQVIDFL